VIIATWFVGSARVVTTSMAHTTHAAAAPSHHQNDECRDEREIGKIVPVHGTSPFGIGYSDPAAT
jgi:hypothetical protein